MNRLARPIHAPSRTMAKKRPRAVVGGVSRPLKRMTQTLQNDSLQVLKAGFLGSARWMPTAPIIQTAATAATIRKAWFRFQFWRAVRNVSRWDQVETRGETPADMILPSFGMTPPVSALADRRRGLRARAGTDDQLDRRRAVLGADRFRLAHREEQTLQRRDARVGIEEHGP